MEEKIAGLIERWKQTMRSKEEKELAGVSEFLGKQGFDEKSFRLKTIHAQVKTKILSAEAPLLLQGLSMMLETGDMERETTNGHE